MAAARFRDFDIILVAIAMIIHTTWTCKQTSTYGTVHTSCIRLRGCSPPRQRNLIEPPVPHARPVHVRTLSWFQPLHHRCPLGMALSCARCRLQAVRMRAQSPADATSSPPRATPSSTAAPRDPCDPIVPAWDWSLLIISSAPHQHLIKTS